MNTPRTNKNTPEAKRPADGGLHLTPRSSSFDGVQREPIDRAAAMMFAKGTKAPTTNMGTMEHWETCPAVFTYAELKRRNVHENLTGRRQGLMIVIGLAREIEARWIMRCDCGDYEPRKAKAIKNPTNDNDRCAKCRQLVEAKRAHEFHATGRNVAERFPVNVEVRHGAKDADLD